MTNTLLADKHILIVEDDEACLVLATAILKDCGCSFDVASDGQTAVEKMKQGKFDAVLMDVRIPVVNGYDAAKKIRDFNSDVPILAVTAHVMPWVKGKCLAAGMNDYIEKPFDSDDLIALIIKHTTV